MMEDREYEYEWLDGGLHWRTEPTLLAGKTCRQPGCDRPAVAAFYRIVHGKTGTHERIWRSCDLPEHLYGGRFVDGRVQQRFLVGSHAWTRAKERAALAAPSVGVGA